MQSPDKSFVKYLLSLSMLLPAATASAATVDPSAVTGNEARPIAQTEAPSAAMAAKLSELAGTEEQMAFIQNWWNNQVAGPEASDDAAHLSSANLLALTTKLNDLAGTAPQAAFPESWMDVKVAGPEEKDDAAHLASADLLALTAKLSDLAGDEQNEICNQKWADIKVAGPEEKDDAEHLSSADLLRAIKAGRA